MPRARSRSALFRLVSAMVGGHHLHDVFHKPTLRVRHGHAPHDGHVEIQRQPQILDFPRLEPRVAEVTRRQTERDIARALDQLNRLFPFRAVEHDLRRTAHAFQPVLELAHHLGVAVDQNNLAAPEILHAQRRLFAQRVRRGHQHAQRRFPMKENLQLRIVNPPEIQPDRLAILVERLLQLLQRIIVRAQRHIRVGEHEP